MLDRQKEQSALCWEDWLLVALLRKDLAAITVLCTLSGVIKVWRGELFENCLKSGCLPNSNQLERELYLLLPLERWINFFFFLFFVKTHRHHRRGVHVGSAITGVI